MTSLALSARIVQQLRYHAADGFVCSREPRRYCSLLEGRDPSPYLTLVVDYVRGFYARNQTSARGRRRGGAAAMQRSAKELVASRPDLLITSSTRGLRRP